MAPVLRWAVVYWTVAQIIIFCAAEASVHIQLNLDGKEIINDIKNENNKKYAALEKIPDLVKIWYNSQAATKPIDIDDTQRALVEKDGLKKLYIRGEFQVKDKDDNPHFAWDNGKKGVKELGALVLQIFKENAVVIVVFPDDLQTFIGFKFQKEFEEVVQSKNEKITVGRGVINVYLGLGDQNKVEDLLNNEINHQKRTTLKDHEKDEKYYSIFAKYHTNTFSFRTVFTEWRSKLPTVNIYQVKIQEADSVVVKLMSVCTSTPDHLKVGSLEEQEIADILFKLVKVEGGESHPEQKVRFELPENCGTAKEREVFTGKLADNLLQKSLNAFGKEPQLHIHVYKNEKQDDTFHKDIKHITDKHKEDIVAEIKNDDIKTQVNEQGQEAVSSARELFIHVHCHGDFYGTVARICGKDSATLAGILSKFVKSLLRNSVAKNGFVQLHVCEAGNNNGQKYIISFLTKLNELLVNNQITIKESVSYKYETSQISEHTQVMVPMVPGQRGLYEPNVNEKQVFGRFTVRTTKTAQGYKAFTVSPFTEYYLSTLV